MSESHRARQLVFNGVWRGLKSQGFEPSTDGDGECRYRGHSGRRCAAGWLIREEHYAERLEGELADNPSVIDAMRPTFEPFGVEVPVEFVGLCQGAHDFVVGSDPWEAVIPTPAQIESNLRALADRHNLTIPDGD